jgi:hypothetical protein
MDESEFIRLAELTLQDLDRRIEAMRHRRRLRVQ